MKYTFKGTPEFLWLIAGAVVLALAQVALTFDPTTITDWKTYAVGIVGLLVRTIGGAAIAYLGKQKVTGKKKAEKT